MGKIVVRSAKEREVVQIPLEKIVVLNTRNRDENQHKENRRSISEVGLQKPIGVSDYYLKQTDKYLLIFGEGRLLSHRELGRTHIDAEIFHVDEETALLMGLAENLTRKRKDIIDFARRIVQMYDDGKGVSYADLAKITGKSEATMRNYIELMQKGEERLIRGIENDTFTIDFAMKVIQNPKSEVQNFLMNEFQEGKITTSDLEHIRKILEKREEKGLSNANLTHAKLSASVREETKHQKRLYKQRKVKRNDAIYLAESLRLLWEDEQFNQMAAKIKGLEKPEIKGQY